MHAALNIRQNTWRAGNAWFSCDRCSQRWRRGRMQVEWTNLRVCPPCLDPRPPQMMPPNVYPEGIPFLDARAPQDQNDRLQDDTALQSVTGGFEVTPGVTYPDGQNQLPGSLSPLLAEETPLPQGASVLEDDVTFISGPIPAPENT